MTAYYELSTCILVDANKFRKLPTDELQKFTQQLNEFKKPIEFVESLEEKVTQNKLIKSLFGGKDISYLLEYRNKTPISQEDKNTLELFKQLREKALDIVKIEDFSYPFEETKESIENYHFTTKTVSRDFNDYRISLSAAEKLWNQVKSYWADLEDSPKNISINVNGSSYNTVFYENRIVIGYQTIKRWELEQLAVKYNWEFPTN